MSDVQALRDALGSSRSDLFGAIKGLTEEQFRLTADGAGWNIATHLAHLLRCERMLVARARLALTQDDPPVASTGVTNEDDPGLAQRLAVPQIVHGLQASRRDLELLLARAEDAQLDRAIRHERLGRITAREMVQKMAEHEAEHAVTVAQLARQAASARRVTIPLGPRP